MKKSSTSLLCDEIRYARVTSISLKLTAAVFHLIWNYQNLTSTEYTETLISYLNSARCCKRITIDDLCNIMHGIAGQIDMIGTVVDKENDTGWGQTDDKSMLGELVLPNWLEGHITRWYNDIAVAEKSGKLLISYMIHADSKGKVRLLLKLQKFWKLLLNKF